MICEILNSYRDTYVNLHCVLTLAVYLKNLVHENSQVFGKLMVGVKTLLNKLSSNVGLDDASSLHLGYAIVNVLSHEIDETNDVQTLLPQCMTRIIKTQLPSAIKSYTLPVSYIFAVRPDDLLPQLIMVFSQKEGKAGTIMLLQKIIENYRQVLQHTSSKNLSDNNYLTL